MTIPDEMIALVERNETFQRWLSEYAQKMQADGLADDSDTRMEQFNSITGRP